jgi:hypothetical protein
MTNEKLLGEDLLSLLNEKGNVCVSIIVPTHRTSPGRRADKLETEKAIDHAKQLLQYKYPEHQIKPLLYALDELFQASDFLHNTEGIGLYVSSNIKIAIQFPFPVKEKVMVENDFEIRDLLYKINYSTPYHVLMLTEKCGRLFEGCWNNLSEIKDNNWPTEYKDDYIYEKPAHSSHYAGYSHVKMYEKDKSELEAVRFKNFFHQLDKSSDAYLIDNTPLIVLGPQKELSWFEQVSKHKKNIINKIHGSFNYSNLKSLSDLAWPPMFEYLQNERKQLVKEFEEKIGAYLSVSGIQEIWEAANEGKALKLLVEKDFRCPGFIVENDHHLYLCPPQKPHKILADAIDELIETVLEKKGYVYFMNNDMLKDYGRIALIKRY